MPVVLVVEDDGLVRDVVEAMVEELEHRPISAANVDEALAILRGPEAVDLLLTDIRLQQAIHGGCELARQARALRPEIGLVYVTAYYEPALKSLLIPDAPLLLKPYSREQLTKALNTALDGRSVAAD